MIQNSDANSALFFTCPVLILAGGLGTRLQSAYADGPKVMAPVAGRPFLSYLLGAVAAAGLRNVILCVGHRFELIQAWLGDGAERGISVEYSIETKPLGTGGALRLAHPKLARAQRFFVLNGDSFLQIDFRKMFENHIRGVVDATMALARVDDSSRYGTVSVDDSGMVTEFSEKSGEHVPGTINAGIYLMESSVLELIPADRFVSLEREVLPRLLNAGLRGFSVDGYFIDIGVPDDYVRAQAELADIQP